MLKHQVAIVPISVKPECIDEFIKVATANVEASRNEAGVLRFEMLQNKSSETDFTLVEVFKSIEAQLAHRETTHFKVFRDGVASLLQQPYTAEVFGFVSSLI